MVRSREVAAEFAARFANLIGARTQDAANALMQASPRSWWKPNTT